MEMMDHNVLHNFGKTALLGKIGSSVTSENALESDYRILSLYSACIGFI